MPDIKRVGDDGIHTVEGVVAGEAAAEFSRLREQQRQEYERAKNKIKEMNAGGVVDMQQKFNVGSDALDDTFRAATVGLVTAEDFRRARETVDGLKKQATGEEQELSTAAQAAAEEEQKSIAKKKRAEQRKRQRMNHTLSFGDEDEEQGIEEKSGEYSLVSAKRKVGGIKNPHVNTDFLADRGRVAQEQQQEQQRIAEEEQRRVTVKKERMMVQYSYYDGKNHRRAMEVIKGMSISRFVELAKMQLLESFPELRGVSSDGLIYVKDNRIIPHHVTFYDMITARRPLAMNAANTSVGAAGRGSGSQPVFRFDLLEDASRRHVDARTPIEDVHAGKVVNRRWYEKNKHVYPASKWEVFELPKSTNN